MTLEETIRSYAKKGELVHLSLAATHSGEFKVIFAAASPAGGYATAVDKDPVAAILAAFKPVKPARVAKPKAEPTVTVSDAPPQEPHECHSTTGTRCDICFGPLNEEGPTLSDWTKP